MDRSMGRLARDDLAVCSQDGVVALVREVVVQRTVVDLVTLEHRDRFARCLGPEVVALRRSPSVVEPEPQTMHGW
jgi:hypothetical protein